MEIRLLLSFVILLIYSSLFAQGETDNWYFGNHAGLNFSSGSPAVLTNGELNTVEGCSTISDSSGNLLFYTDGITVWNKNHNIMLNGEGLTGHTSSTHSALIVPKPNDLKTYYIFTTDMHGESNGFRYSKVDMQLDGALGGIVLSEKNVFMISDLVSEKIAAIKHSNDNDYWVVSHKFNSNEFISFRITDTGINFSPVISAVGSLVDSHFNEAIGAIKISPNGRKIAVARGGWIFPSEVQIFDFNTSTGVISNPITIHSDNSSLSNQTFGRTILYGIEFSPNSNILYVTEFSFVTFSYYLNQYNLLAGSINDIMNSKVQVHIGNSVENMQLAKNKKIYVARFDNEFLGIINNPNQLGLGCDYIHDGIYLDGMTSKAGLPSFVHSYFYVGFEYENTCLGEVSQLNANISEAYDSLIWNFGDGNTSSLENPTHIYNSSGDFSVTLTVTTGSQVSEDTQVITIYDVPTVAPIVELKQCDNNLDGFSIFNLTEVNAEISVNHLNETIMFYETQVDAESGGTSNLILNEAAYPNQQVSTDMVWARIENSNGCFKTSQVNLIVSNTQIPLNFTRYFYECDDGTDTNDGIATFNFSSLSSEIQALFPVGQQLIINYYRNQADALSENNPITDITNYQNIKSIEKFCKSLFSRYIFISNYR